MFTSTNTAVRVSLLIPASLQFGYLITPNILSKLLWISKSRVTSYTLRVTSCDIKITTYELRSTRYNIKSMSYELQHQKHELRIRIYELNHQKRELQHHNHELRVTTL